METKFILDKSIARKNFQGSKELFESCWLDYRRMIRFSIDFPKDQFTVDNWLEQLASSKVNNSRSSFYIKG